MRRGSGQGRAPEAGQAEDDGGRDATVHGARQEPFHDSHQAILGKRGGLRRGLLGRIYGWFRRPSVWSACLVLEPGHALHDQGRCISPAAYRAGHAVSCAPPDYDHVSSLRLVWIRAVDMHIHSDQAASVQMHDTIRRVERLPSSAGVSRTCLPVLRSHALLRP